MDVDTLSGRFGEDIIRIKEEFSYPINEDFQLRKLFIPRLDKEAVLFYVNGLVQGDVIEQSVITPLLKNKTARKGKATLYKMEQMLPLRGVGKSSDISKIVEGIVRGSVALLIEDDDSAYLLNTSTTEHRGIGEPQSENVIKGPNEGFVESSITNRSLIRKHVRDPKLLTETMTVGQRTKSDVSIMYIKGIANPAFIEELKERIGNLEVDDLQGISVLEQHIEERPYSLLPSILYTERPDRCASFLLEGHIVVSMDHTPACLVLPVTVWSFFHTAEDFNQRFAFGNFIRLIRLLAVFVALLMPSFYIAITNFHIEMLPTDLVLAIAATRERVPFPAVVEVLLMELAFELLREAGVRIPTPIGPTIGIVGALILGQAAVEAHIISPILVIVIAITGLASFAIPDVSFSFAIRISRFIFLFFSMFMGFFGIAVIFTMILAYATTAKSFGVPFLAPVAPHYRSSKDLIIRPPVWKQWIRPQHMKPVESVRQKRKTGSTE
nr:spore germination protein [Bacillus sp. FJAT-45350]